MLENQLEKNKIKLSEIVIKAIKELNFSSLTPVQIKSIPVFLKNYDVAVQAVTGSGKTLSYVIPIIERLIKIPNKINKFDIFALIIVPTRELAVQVYKVLLHFLSFLTFSICQLVGGQSVNDCVKDFTSNGGNVSICTPGRAEAFLKQRHTGFDFASCLEKLEILIIDEADRLLADGYRASIETILRYLPKQRRTGLFSATLNDEIASLMKFGMRNPRVISLGAESTPTNLRNYYKYLSPLGKIEFLLSFIQKYKTGKIIVFFATCASTSYYYKVFSRILPKISFFCLHRKQRGKREVIFNKFVTSHDSILLCTDIVARGIDIPDVEWVIQFDPPKIASSFVHRCGRTARMGRKGRAIILLNPHEDVYVNFLKINQKVDLDEFEGNLEETSLSGVLREFSESERELMEDGVLAFVSYIKAYLKHPLKPLFDIKKVPVGSLAESFGVLKIPRMVEIRGNDSSTFVPSLVDIDSIPYKDRKREESRKLMAKDNLAKKEAKRRLNAKYARKREKMKAKRKTAENNILDDVDLEEIEADYCLLKKYRSGKMNKSQFESRFLK